MSYTKNLNKQKGIVTYHSYGYSELGLKEMYQDGSISSSSLLIVGKDAVTNVRHRINFKINLEDFVPYASINSMKLKLHLTSGITSNLELCQESSLTSDEGVHLDYFKSNPTEVEIDLTKHLSGNFDKDMYFSIRTVQVSNDYFEIYSKDCNENLKPEMIIEAIDESIGQIRQAHIDGDIGRAGNYSLNIRSGKISFTKNLFAYGGELDPLALSLNYDIDNRTSNKINGLDNGMPKGWRINYGESIVQEGNSVRYVDSCGCGHIFSLATNSTNKYYDLGGCGLIIVKNSDNTYTLDTDRNIYHDFNTSGLLTRIRRVNGTNTISTVITYVENTAKIASITDGMGHTVNFTYSNSSMSFDKDSLCSYVINYDTSTGLIDSIVEGSTRMSHYTFDSKGRLLTAHSNNGEKLTLTYDNIGRVSSIKEAIFKDSVETTIKNYQLTYKAKMTIVEDLFGVTNCYSFNDDGSFLSQYEKVSLENENFKMVSQDGFDSYYGMTDPNNYQEFRFSGSNTATLNSTKEEQVISSSSISSVGDFVLEANKKYFLVFSYDSKTLSSNNDGFVGIRLMKNDTLVKAIKISNLYQSINTMADFFELSSLGNLRVELVHNGADGAITFSKVRIYPYKEAISYTCLNKYTGLSTISGDTQEWYKMNNIVKFTYSNDNIEVNEVMYQEDMEANLKNIARGSTDIWCAHKRILITNATNVRVYFDGNPHYLLSELKMANVSIKDGIKSFVYSDYTADSSYPNLLRIIYTVTKLNSRYTSYKVENTDYNIIKEKKYDGTYTTYTYDEYGNVTLEEMRNTND